jgi:hypothetical protein
LGFPFEHGIHGLANPRFRLADDSLQPERRHGSVLFSIQALPVSVMPSRSASAIKADERLREE